MPDARIFQGEKMIHYLYIFLALFCIHPSAISETNNPPKILLAKSYQSHINLEKYWVSEKLDGVRAYWDGTKLISRQGNVFTTPKWFTESLPKDHLDGELWLGRGRFEKVSGLVRRRSSNTSDWENIRYMVFDLPNSPYSFDQRLKTLRKVINAINKKHIKLVPQYKIKSHEILQNHLIKMANKGAEGLMLHAGDSLYKSGRYDDLLKMKLYSDAEAIVIEHRPGKGKYKGMLGSLLVETTDKKRFKVGSGFTDKQRKFPPKIGDLITYKYYGLTKNGIPRFASFLRIRKKH